MATALTILAAWLTLSAIIAALMIRNGNRRCANHAAAHITAPFKS